MCKWIEEGLIDVDFASIEDGIAIQQAAVDRYNQRYRKREVT